MKNYKVLKQQNGLFPSDLVGYRLYAPYFFLDFHP